MGRKVVTFLVLVCFCAATLPFPVASVEILDKANSQPFPCQNCPCGCKTAEQCWSGCCCYTPAERFAWAERNGVTPPSYAVRPSRNDTAMDSSSSHSRNGKFAKEINFVCSTPQKACCTKHSCKAVSGSKCNDSCQSQDRVTVIKKSCASCRQVSQPDSVGSRKLNSATKRKIVLTMFALKCQGKSSAFTLLPWTILTNIQNVVLYEHEHGPAHPVVAMAPASVYSRPDTPPPK
jgi:hypothetical protein